MQAPSPFSFQVTGPDGLCSFRFRPLDEWDGEFAVSMAGRTMTWRVLTIDREPDDGLSFSGMTEGGVSLWGEDFWFVIRATSGAVVVSYWRDQTCWRTDVADPV